MVEDGGGCGDSTGGGGDFEIEVVDEPTVAQPDFLKPDRLPELIDDQLPPLD